MVSQQDKRYDSHIFSSMLQNTYRHSKTYIMKKDSIMLKLQKLHYRYLRKDMGETYKLVTGKYYKGVANFLLKKQDNSTGLPTRRQA